MAEKPKKEVNLKQKVVSLKNKEVGSIDLEPALFGVTPRKDLVHMMVRWQRAKRRAGTHSTLTRTNMEGGAKKPWKQKGTGRARAGSSISPLWVGGAVVFGPSPRDYEFRLPKRARRDALCAVLSDKVQKEKLIVVDDFQVASGKTRDLVAVLSDLGVQEQKLTLLVAGKDEKLARAQRNLKGVKMFAADGNGLNVYDVLNSGFLVATKAAIETLQKKFAEAGAGKGKE